REAEYDKQCGNREVEPWRRIDRPERSRREDDNEAKHAIDECHRSAVGRAKQKSPASRLCLRTSANDRKIDWNHRQHARRQIQSQSTNQHEKKNRQRSTSLEHSLRLD